jgi:biopolymer transport protein TolR
MPFGRLERGGAPKPMSEINMTPLIDVMLVLLVIFMITAPLMTSSLPLELPKSDAPASSETPGAMSIAVNAQGQFFLDDKPLSDAQLAQRLAETGVRDPETELQIRADKAVPYGRVADLLNAIQKAGLTRIGFVTEPNTTAPMPGAQQP